MSNNIYMELDDLGNDKFFVCAPTQFRGDRVKAAMVRESLDKITFVYMLDDTDIHTQQTAIDMALFAGLPVVKGGSPQDQTNDSGWVTQGVSRVDTHHLVHLGVWAITVTKTLAR